MMLGRHTLSSFSTQHWRGKMSASAHGFQQFDSVYLLATLTLIDLFTSDPPTTITLAQVLLYSIAESKLLKTIYTVLFLFFEVVRPHSFFAWVASVTSLCTFQALFSHLPANLQEAHLR